jgi:hypothetical protein
MENEPEPIRVDDDLAEEILEAYHADPNRTYAQLADMFRLSESQIYRAVKNDMKMIRNCAVCGGEFVGNNRRQIYCDISCRWRSRTPNN